MDIATLYARRGQPGLEQLAKETGLSVVYLQRLLYVLSRRPSVERAQLLISKSAKLWPREGLTLDGLTNPKPYREAIAAELAAGRAYEKFVLRASKPPRKAAGEPKGKEPK